MDEEVRQKLRAEKFEGLRKEFTALMERVCSELEPGDALVFHLMVREVILPSIAYAAKAGGLDDEALDAIAKPITEMTAKIFRESGIEI